MIEAVITPLAHSRTLRIEKLPAFNRRNDRSSSIEKQLPLSAAWAKGGGSASEDVPRHPIVTTNDRAHPKFACARRYNSATDIRPVYQHANTGCACSGCTHGRSADHRAPGC